MEACKQYFNTKYVRLPDLLIHIKLKVDSRNWNYIRTVRGVGYKFQPLSGE